MMERAPSARSSEGSTDIWRWIRYEFGAIARLIARSDTAFIAAINGPAAGVGLAWALTCDLAIASEQARIVPAFGRLGLLPEVGTSWAIPGGWAIREHLPTTPAANSSTRAREELGLVHEVVPPRGVLAAPTPGARGSQRSRRMR